MKNRILTFSLRSLLLVVIFLAISFGLYRQFVLGPLERQQQALIKLQASGAKISYLVPGLPSSMQGSFQSKPTANTRTLADFLLQTQGAAEPIVGISFVGEKCEIGNEELLALQNLQDLEYLDLTWCHMWREGEKSFGENLGCPKVTDEGLKHLVSLRKLRVLIIGNSSISDDAGKVIRQLTNLESLVLSECHVTDAIMDDLGNLENLQELWIGNTHITQARIDKFCADHPGIRVSPPPSKRSVVGGSLKTEIPRTIVPK